MPLQQQKSVEDDDTRYVPPPNAYQKSAVRSIPINPKRPTVQFTEIARNVVGGFRERAERRAQERAERAERRAQEQIGRTTQKAQPRTIEQPRAPHSAASYQQTTHLDEPVALGHLSWRQLFYVYSVILALFVIVWMLDGFFTILGLLRSGMPATGFGVIVSVGLHLLASWGQRSLIFDPFWVLKLIGIGLITMNVTANIIGIRLAITVMSPVMAGTLPLNPWQWLIALAQNGGRAIMGQDAAWPPWWPAALVIIVLAGGLAWFAEPLLSGVHRRWQVICRQRR